MRRRTPDGGTEIVREPEQEDFLNTDHLPEEYVAAIVAQTEQRTKSRRMPDEFETVAQLRLPNPDLDPVADDKRFTTPNIATSLLLGPVRGINRWRAPAPPSEFLDDLT